MSEMMTVCRGRLKRRRSSSTFSTMRRSENHPVRKQRVMPELPEVETIRRIIEPQVTGRMLDARKCRHRFACPSGNSSVVHGAPVAWNRCRVYQNVAVPEPLMLAIWLTMVWRRYRRRKQDDCRLWARSPDRRCKDKNATHAEMCARAGR
ncbi:DNA-formamidopyrimidine glycosylase family protein [Bifidobacterium moukalabense]|uniref:DNA-formamidopyrimidine glycosylase family protein n=2 Tax=Bifidobacterium moukalabense TaxID=1333651 RepID=UPI00353063DF